MQSVGVIRQHCDVSVKSMQGEALLSAALTLRSSTRDRRYAFVRTASHSSFPWLTALKPRSYSVSEPRSKGRDSPEVFVTVATPAARGFGSDDLRKVLEGRSGKSLFLLRDYRGSYDVAPVSLISRQTVARIAEESGTKENSWRFRPNLLVDLTEAEAFSDELKWVGRTSSHWEHSENRDHRS